ncbi:MAG: hypothetical protein PHP74_02775 [Candidatus Gracilibacteria bacterium]|nr:hypothetical protein [Candidatus Gracilibacteria bacterium]
MSENVEKNLWNKVRKVLPLLSMVPFLRMVAVCNNLAFGKVDEESDIDLFIIAKKGRLFFVRSVITLLLHLRGVRRHGRKISGRFCLSFFVDDSFLDLSKISIDRDFYLAYWIKSMVPIFDDGIFSLFIKKNAWVGDYFDLSVKFERKVFEDSFGGKTFCNKFYSFVFSGYVGDFLEAVLKKWQIKRALKKSKKADKDASLIVEEHILKFHNVDRREFYRNKWIGKYGFDAKLTEKKFLSLGFFFFWIVLFEF